MKRIHVYTHTHMQALDIAHYAKLSNGVVGLIDYSSGWWKKEVPLS